AGITVHAATRSGEDGPRPGPGDRPPRSGIARLAARPPSRSADRAAWRGRLALPRASGRRGRGGHRGPGADDVPRAAAPAEPHAWLRRRGGRGPRAALPRRAPARAGGLER